MHVAVLGYGISGKAVCDYLKKRGDQITLIDRHEHTLDIPSILDSTHPSLLGVELFVKSPGIPNTHPWVQHAINQKIPVCSEIDLALQELAKKNKTLYAITGSNGKTTTTLLTAHVLNEAHKKVKAVGNVGVSLLSEIDADVDIFVIELSSFQIENLKCGPFFDAAIVLNITANHLDRYQTLEAYANAKLRLQTCLKENGVFYCSAAIVKQFGHPQNAIIFDACEERVETICSLLYREGVEHFCRHDVQNVAASLVLSQFDCSEEIFWKGVSSFKKPPHRVEWVRTVKGVRYVNDSKATSVDAVVKAVESMPDQVILIAGGVDKGGAYSDWIPLFRKKVKAVVTIGEAASRMIKELGAEIRIERANSLEKAFDLAQAQACLGDTILLSPGCSSYDQFRDYQQRGDAFKELVKLVKCEES